MGILGWDVNDTQRGHKKGFSVGGFGKRNLGHGVNAYVVPKCIATAMHLVQTCADFFGLFCCLFDALKSFS